MDNLFVLVTNLVSRFRLRPEGGVLGRDADPFHWEYLGITLQAPPFKVDLQRREMRAEDGGTLHVENKPVRTLWVQVSTCAGNYDVEL